MTTQQQAVNIGSGIVWIAAVLTTAVLFVLQVTGLIHISWLLVFAPMIVVFALSVVFALIVLAILAITLLVLHGMEKKHRAKNAPNVTPARMRDRRIR